MGVCFAVFCAGLRRIVARIVVACIQLKLWASLHSHVAVIDLCDWTQPNSDSAPKTEAICSRAKVVHPTGQTSGLADHLELAFTVERKVLREGPLSPQASS